jgi:hypothetical protein
LCLLKCSFQNGFFIYPNFISARFLQVSGVNPVIFRQFGQYNSSPGYLGHTLVSAISCLPFAEAGIGRLFRPVALANAVARFNGCHYQQNAFSTTRALLWVASIKHLEGFHPVAAFCGFVNGGNIKLFAYRFDAPGFISRRQNSEMPYLHKPHGQHVCNKPLQKIGSFDCHQPRFRGPVVDPRKRHLPIGKGFDTVVADGHPVRISADIVNVRGRSEKKYPKSCDFLGITIRLKMGERTLQKGVFEMAKETVQGNAFTFSALAIGKSVKCSHFCD